MKLTREMVLKGAEFTKVIEVDEYGGAEVEIRPLTDSQLVEVMTDAPVGKLLQDPDTVRRIKAQGKDATEEEKEALAADLIQEGAVEGTTMDGAMAMSRKACGFGIVDPALRKVIGSFSQGATIGIGMAIIDLSTGNVAEVMDFITAQMDS